MLRLSWQRHLGTSARELKMTLEEYAKQLLVVGGFLDDQAKEVLFATSLLFALLLNKTMQVTPDSVHYLSNDFLPYWPPLYSGLLNTLSFITGIDTTLMAKLVNSVSYALIIIAFDDILKGKKQWIRRWASLFLLFSLPFIVILGFVWSEMLFCLFVLLALKAFGEKNLRNAVIMTMLATLTRYAGIVLIPIGLVVFWDSKKAILYTSSAIPLVMWLTRNYLVSGTLTGQRNPSVTGMLENIFLSIMTIVSWFSGHTAVFIVLVGIILLLARFKPQRGDWLYLCFAIIYTGFIILSSTITAYDPIDTRLLVPVYLSITVFCTSLLEQLPIREWLKMSLAFLWLIAPLKVVVLMVTQ